jgi:hypothetical protein
MNVAHYFFGRHSLVRVLADGEAGLPVRKVQRGGEVHFGGRLLPVSKAFRGQPVGVRATNTDGLVEVLFCHQVIKRLTLGECPKAE